MNKATATVSFIAGSIVSTPDKEPKQPVLTINPGETMSANHDEPGKKLKERKQQRKRK